LLHIALFPTWTLIIINHTMIAVPIIIVSASYIYRAKQQTGHTQKILAFNGDLAAFYRPTMVSHQSMANGNENA
jgi:hypothetical protein